MKKLLAVLLAFVMVLSLAACGEGGNKNDTIKVGMICIGNPNLAYDANFINAANAATERLAKKGYDIEWLYKYDHPVDDDQVTTDNLELASEGCIIVFNNSYGQEEYMLKAAREAKDTIFVGCTSDVSWNDDLDNTANTFADIYQGRYLAGIAAGMKLNELIEKGEITKEQAVLGYVGAFHFAEVISGYTSFFLGARSVCPSAVMYVQFINSWGSTQDEEAAAQALIDNYHAVVISQHSDTYSPSTTAQANGVFHVGYNADMTLDSIAPDASIVSPRIDWTNYFEYAIECAIKGEKIQQDYCGTLAAGDVVLCPLNEKIAAPGTAEAIESAKAKLISGEIKVFDTSTFTVGGKTVTEAFAFDTDGDWTPDSQNYIIDGEAKESEFRSAPYFALDIDGITLVN